MNRDAIGPIVVALACLGAIAVGPTEPPPSAVSAPDPSVHALLGELHVGGALVGWTVIAISGPHDGVIRIDLGRDRVRFALMLAKKGTMREPAPVETEQWAIYYGHVDPPDTELPANTIRATTNALANRVRATEASVTVDGT